MPMKSLGRLRMRAGNQVRNGYARNFSTGMRRETDGVYRELTAMRTRVPFIEAFRREEAKKAGRDVEEGEEEKVGGEKEKVVQRGEGEGLEMKSMRDSFHRVILPLASDPWLLDNYITASGHIRLGAIFMDLDALAGVISYKHTGDRVMTVTAAVDRITLSRPLLEICDLELSGQVTFATGRSSMEVSLQVCKVPSVGQENQPRRKEDVFMECAFTMVSLDPVTKKAVRIAGVRPEGEVEESWFERGRKSYEKKKRELGRGLRSMEPDDEESDLIHRLWLKTLDYHDPNTPSLLPKTCTRMSNSTIQSVQIMQPQYRNRHNFMIFGGFLLKSTFELAFTCASAISHSRPIFLGLDPSTFENPVPVGSVLYGDAETETEAETGKGKKTRVQIRVDTKVKNVEHGETKPTGQFNYTFEVEGEVQVLPESYREFMVYLDARRRSKGRVEERGKEMGEGNAKPGKGIDVLGAGGDGGLKVL
ncbi:putative acyl- thioester hydrolase protein [Botrytis fragariae]|uniref:Putative acyl- thioester hydrolase protein n=1 Tax=Botrytis fragariae TaxID=1964551 RepID=A0A8H6AWH4_9HELO|nr:putative acyl- thioester hydrolase protein [Botrytis fragariae]KAF5874881.1 putative acyl- thioester hydrolase protein [Botrytis fragariae]